MTAQNSIVIIGSGFAGSFSAKKLIEAGYDVTLLERGPWRNTKATRAAQIPHTAPLPIGWKFFTHLLRGVNQPKLPKGRFTLNRKGVYEIFVGDKIDVICSSHVGGNSHVYGGLHIRPTDPEYWNGHHPSISSQYMETYYRHVLKDMQSQPIDISTDFPNMFRDRFKENPHFITNEHSINMDMGLRHLLPSHDIAQLSSNGLLGSDSGLKRTTDEMTLLPLLEKGLKIRDMCEVNYIERIDSDGVPYYTIHFRDHHKRQNNQITSPKVILAAGTINTVKLLLQSRDKKKTIYGMPRLGHQFGGNGDYSAYWSNSGHKGDMSEGIPTRGKVLLSDLAQWSSSNSWPNIVEGGLPYSRNLPWLPFITSKIRQGSLIAAMGPDRMDGRISFQKNRFEISYNPDNSPIYSDIRAAFNIIEKLSSQPIIHFPKVSTVHPSGGACLGASEQNGVIDHGGQIYGHPGLYIADGSALPSALGTPPSISIAAWSCNVADKIISM